MNPPATLSIQCNPCRASIGVPCRGDGSVCANRITRALMIGAGVAPDVRTGPIAQPAAPSPVLVEDAAARKVPS